MDTKSIVELAYVVIMIVSCVLYLVTGVGWFVWLGAMVFLAVIIIARSKE